MKMKISSGVSGGVRTCCLRLPCSPETSLRRYAPFVFGGRRRLLGTKCCASSGSKNKEKVIVISGPTGAGKSRLALELAKRLNGEIISADSVQVRTPKKKKKNTLGCFRNYLFGCKEKDRKWVRYFLLAPRSSFLRFKVDWKFECFVGSQLPRGGNFTW